MKSYTKFEILIQEFVVMDFVLDLENMFRSSISLGEGGEN